MGSRFSLVRPASRGWVRAVALLMLQAGCGTDAPAGPGGADSPIPSTVVVEPNPDTVVVGKTVQLLATVTDSEGRPVTNVSVTWRSLNPNRAEVSTTGLVSGVSAGAATIEARAGAVTGTGQVVVRPAPSLRLEISPDGAEVHALQDTIRLIAVTVNQDGVRTPAAPVWMALDPLVGDVDGDGLFRAAGNGTARVVATYDSLADTASVVVRQLAEMLVLFPRQFTLYGGDTVSMRVTAADSGGSSIDSGFVWTSSTAAVSVTGTGRLRADQAGTSVVAVRHGPTGTGSGAPGDAVNVSVAPGPAGMASWASVTAGELHTCALAGGGALYCWGSNDGGRLGVPGAGPFVQPVAVADSISFDQVAPGAEFTCGVDTAGAAWCWGWNASGQLGDGTIGFAEGGPEARQVIGGHSFQMVATSQLESARGSACGVSDAGEVLCWGYNVRGQLGRTASVACPSSPGDTCDPVPAPVSGGGTYTTISVGDLHACGLQPGGAAWCWGYGFLGQLGVGASTADAFAPVAVSGGLTFAGLALGEAYSCGLTTTGEVHCWGVINGSREPAPMPGGTGVVSLTAGAKHLCALLADGSARCWGSTHTLALGDGLDLSAAMPVTVLGNQIWVAISAGGGHTCGRTGAGGVWCWGAGEAGQLGIGLSGVAVGTSFPLRILDP